MKRITLKIRKVAVAAVALSLVFACIPLADALSEEEVSALPQARRQMQQMERAGMPGLSSQKPGGPEYVPGELIVKLKDGKTLADLRALNDKYQVGSTEKVFPDTPQPEDTLEKLKNKLAGLGTSEHDKWYWQLDKNSQEYKDYAAKLEKEKAQLQGQIKAQEELIACLAERQKRAPAGLTTPNLENIYLLNAPYDTDILKATKEYAQNAAVEYAEPNYLAHTDSIPRPKDPLYAQQWAHQKTQIEQAWNVFTKVNRPGFEFAGRGVIVAVIDSGVDYNHEDLKENIWRDGSGKPGRDFVDIDKEAYRKAGYELLEEFEDYTQEDDDPNDNLIGHGTHCAGIIAAKGNNQIGVIGVCPNCRIMPVKVGFLIIDTEGYYGIRSEGDDLANGIHYAADKGADVINLSVGSPAGSMTLKSAVDYASSKGVVLVASAGNQYTDAKQYPVAYPNVISVAATDKNDYKCDFSNYGEWVDVAAPGKEMLSTVPPNWTLVFGEASMSGYATMDGTSAACPYVAGLAGLIISRYAELSDEPLKAEKVRKIIRNTADFIPEYKYDLTRRVNAYQALSIGEMEMEIASPAYGETVSGKVDIKGSAYLRDISANYKLAYAPEDKPEQLTEIATSLAKKKNTVLGSWDTSGCPGGKYLLILSIELPSGQRQLRQVSKVKINSPPVFIPLADQGAVVGRTLSFKVEARDVDDPATPAGRLEYTLTNREAADFPPGGEFNPQTRVFSWTPAKADRNTYRASFQVRDNQYSVSQTIGISTVCVKETRITTDPSIQQNPFICGDKIVWEDKRNYYINGRQSDIYMYDLTQKLEQKVTDSQGGMDFFPVIDGDKIVWNSAGSNSNIYLFEFSTGKRAQLTTTGMQFNPFIQGNRLVWAVAGAGYSLYYLDDIQRGVIKHLSNNGSRFPVIYKDKIAWISSGDIYLADLAIPEADKRITKLIADAMETGPRGSTDDRCSIYKDKIAWISEGRRMTPAKLYLYNLSTKGKTIVTSGLRKEHIFLNEDKICWDSNLGGIGIYDLTKQREIAISEYGGYPRVYQDKVVWSEFRDRAGGWDIFMAQIFYLPEITRAALSLDSREAKITITGKDFGYTQEDSQVLLENGVKALVRSWSNNQIICNVSPTANIGRLKVVNFAGESNCVAVASPRIGDILVNPAAGSSAGSTVFSATVTDSGGSGVRCVYLRWGRGTWLPDGGDQGHYLEMKYDAKIAKYTVTVQPFTWKKGEWIYYYLTAQDRAGNKAQTQAKEITIGR